MPLSVIQQPNGLFTVFSDVVDGFMVVDGTEDDVRRYIVNTNTPDATRTVERMIDYAVLQGPNAARRYLAICVELAEMNNPDDMLLPMVKAMLREAPCPR
jgi:hypothetical protein